MPEQLRLDLMAIFKPYQKQSQFLLSQARNRFFCAGRFAGKSWTLTLDVLFSALVYNQGAPGALLGRTESDLKNNLLPFLMGHLDTLQRATGYNWVRRYSVGDQCVELMNGSKIMWKGYDRISKLRGYNLAYIAADEVCWSEQNSMTIYETLLPAIRVPCRRPSFSIASSPNGLRGITELFRTKQLEGDLDFHVTRCSSYSNPYVDRSVVESCKASMSRARYEQEILALALKPSSAVFDQFQESKHVVSHDVLRHSDDCKWVFGVDWGISKAAAVAIQVLPCGRWVVVDELITHPVSRGHFRQDVKAFIKKWCGKKNPFLISADRAIPSENMWLAAEYGPGRTIVKPLETKKEQSVSNGIKAVQDLLAPMQGDANLVFLRSLSRTIKGDLAGVLPALQNYRFKLDREGNPTDMPYKDNITDHILDALRMAVVAGLPFAELHGGKKPMRLAIGSDGHSSAPIRIANIR